MFCFLFVAVFTVAVIRAQESDVPDDKVRCVRQMVDWCDGMQYPPDGSGMAIESLSYQDKNSYSRVLCIADSEGTNCTKNGSPWFTCSPDHTLTYMGEVLTKISTGVDDGVCDTADKALKTLHVQNFSYDNATLTRFHEAMGSFFEEMAAMQEQLMELQKRLSSDFASGPLGGFFADSEIAGNSDSNNKEPSIDSGDQETSKESNQIEKE